MLPDKSEAQPAGTLPEAALTVPEQRQRIIELIADNHFNRFDRETARRLLEHASAKPFADFPTSFSLLPVTEDCPQTSNSDLEKLPDFERAIDAWRLDLACRIAAVKEDAAKAKALEPEIERFFAALTANARRTIDPKLGELAGKYLFSVGPENQLKPLAEYYDQRLKNRDALRHSLASLHAKLPEIRWLCHVASEYRWELKDFAAAMLGWLATALLASLGAPFWFDLLGRLVNLRGVGSKPLGVGGDNARRK
jgi:hypothetical protein